MYTRSIALAVAGMMASTPAMASDSYFSCGAPMEEGTTVELGLIRSEGPGMVEVYDYRLGKAGDLLGTIDVNEGANADVTLTTTQPIRADVLAVLKVNGQVVAEKHYHVCDTE